MDNKIDFSIETIDKEFGKYIPNGTSRDLFREKYPNTFNSVDEIKNISNKNFLETIYNHIYPFANFCDVQNIDQQKHLYYMPVYSVSFYDENKDYGFKFISEKIKSDVRNNKSKIIIHATDEGYFGCEVDDTLSMIDNWRKREGFPQSSVIFINGNLISNEICKKKNLGIECIGTPLLSESYLKTDVLSDDICNFNPQKDKYLFLSYNRNSHTHRMYMGVKLYEKNLIKNGLVSFHNFVNEEQHIQRREELNDFFHENLVNSFLSTIPIKIQDIDGFADDIQFNVGQEIFLMDFEQTFLTLTTETLAFNNAIYCSEKTFKPIAVGHPFMIYGSKNSLKELKKLGYKTFDKWWSEEYDKCEHFVDRADMIVSELKKIEKMPLEELKQMRVEMIPTLKHNKNLFNERVHTKEEKLYHIFKNIYHTLK